MLFRSKKVVFSISIARGALESIFDECDKYDVDETGGRLLGTYRRENGRYDIEVKGVLEPGPKAERSPTFFLQDGDYQEKLFRSIEASHPDIEHLGNWHTHHVNGYPLFLPAFDETLTFDKSGELTNVRVVLTDGGIYDNLGLGCLWPDRSVNVSLNVIPVDAIICCSAGYGLRQEPPSQFIFARMLSVFSAVFDRAQNASMHRLHEAKRSGQIKSFILPYLGQLDRELPNPPANLVRREEAHSYPTDFNAMPEEWIERLSLRGEQLTFCLAHAYIPELIREASVMGGKPAAQQHSQTPVEFSAAPDSKGISTDAH